MVTEFVCPVARSDASNEFIRMKTVQFLADFRREIGNGDRARLPRCMERCIKVMLLNEEGLVFGGFQERNSNLN